ncbi:uncharacterized protein CLUP02_14811 [Colletotrichum lupini]|uniref:Integral membrane protein n=1 Tax=Colletotrichum lupini TaxID=145971 RepID=A0A9Q8T6U3_9PEZI|nr:uncharacterized protein CLUP02_14811 [Colletotrichum lupini]UQC89282.1 hypothetical protein CLUP02_14811 [Colletotrichum lupini]
MLGKRASAWAFDTTETPALYFGVCIGLLALTSAKAVQQSFIIYSRTNSLKNIYAWMVWILLFANATQAIIVWLLFRGDISINIGFMIADAISWVLQTQLAPQILANRLGLLMHNKQRVKYMKIGLVVFIGIFNLAYIALWIVFTINPSQLAVVINRYLSRLDIVIDLLVNVVLDATFLIIIKRELIAGGLVKYRLLFNCGVAAVCLSISLDVVMMILMSAPNSYHYTCTHPVAYSVRLIIEMLMADLIAVIARTPHEMRDL